ncbi:MAG: acyl-CoA thioesterase [Panacibacter sp.]
MDVYSKKIEVRWSDMDPNFHLRHSVYYDWGAYLRLCFLNDHGLGLKLLQQLHCGPILFREECVFKREILFADTVDVNVLLRKCRKDFSRWTMIHEVWKNGDTLSAIITVDGAWIDTQLRKLTVPPEVIQQGIEAIPKTPDFEWLE